MAEPTLPLMEMIASVLGGGGAVKLFDALANRAKTKAYTMGAVDHAVQTAMTVVTDRLETVEAQHNKCEADLREMRERLDASERDRRELEANIERLMDGPVATYAPRIPRQET